MSESKQSQLGWICCGVYVGWMTSYSFIGGPSRSLYIAAAIMAFGILSIVLTNVAFNQLLRFIGWLIMWAIIIFAAFTLWFINPAYAQPPLPSQISSQQTNLTTNFHQETNVNWVLNTPTNVPVLLQWQQGTYQEQWTFLLQRTKDLHYWEDVGIITNTLSSYTNWVKPTDNYYFYRVVMWGYDTTVQFNPTNLTLVAPISAPSSIKVPVVRASMKPVIKTK